MGHRTLTDPNIKRGEYEVIQVPVSRRTFVRAAGAAAGLTALGLTESQVRGATRPPTSPVVLARCDTYELGDVAKCLATMMDQLGGLERLVVGKTVGVKVNLAGVSREPVRGLSAGRTY